MTRLGILIALMIAHAPGLAQGIAENVIEQKTAELCMDVAVRARVRGLEDFELTTQDKNGSEGAMYSGSDLFEVESNAPIRLVIEGESLHNGVSRLDTVYAIDSQQGNIETGAGVHKEVHSLSAETILGDISDQLAGQYTAKVSITVIPLMHANRSCRGNGNRGNGNANERQQDTRIDVENSLELQRGLNIDDQDLNELESMLNELDPEVQQALIEQALDLLN